MELAELEEEGVEEDEEAGCVREASEAQDENTGEVAAAVNA
jgi:hypothetical protein